jgi:ABC-type branched-subunit amino acid transport system permease subunit
MRMNFERLLNLAASANVTGPLTTLFIYIILGMMWNVLAGYCGLVSVGQQAFFGLGAYAAIRLSYWGVPVYPALILGALLAGVAPCLCRCSRSVSKGVSSPSACG